jgi:hypothetical protein
MTATPRDNASIHDEAALWRRVPPWPFIYDENLARWRPSSAAFADDPDGHPMSVVLAEVVAAAGRVPAQILLGHDGFALAAITAGLARGSGQGVVRDPPWDEPAHALVIGPKTKAVQRRLAKAAVWVVPPPAKV